MVKRQGGGRRLLEDAVIVGGLLVAQCVLAGYAVFIDHLLGLGAHPLAVGGAASAAFFLPLAVALERKRWWPPKVSGVLLAQLALIALGGISAYQELMLLGIKKTTPAVASAMANLSPGFIFIVAACFRLERFDKACKYTQAKIVGTLVCLVGAMAMSFLHSSSPPQAAADDWILGCSCLVAAAVVLSFVTVLQAATLGSFPAPLTMCCITSAMGAASTAILQVILEGRLDMGSPKIDAKLTASSIQSNSTQLLLLGYWNEPTTTTMQSHEQGGMVGGSCVVLQTWCLGKKGPLFVSVFGPVQTVCSAVLSASLLGQKLGRGSLAGMVLMFAGLYAVLWAKRNESHHQSSQQRDDDDAEKQAPLLLS